jgi:threonine/homoserine/homoserine lactone efflux protein
MLETFPHLINSYLVFLLAVISPGPDLAVTVKTSVVAGRMNGIKCAAGVAMANGLHILIVRFGLGPLLLANRKVTFWLQFVCALFLIYLGVQALLSARRRSDSQFKIDPTKTSSQRPFLEGFFINIFNGKAIAFWISYFTMVMKKPLDGWIAIAFPAILILTLFSWFAVVATTFTTEKIRNQFLRREPIFNGLMGLLLIGLSIQIIYQNLN